MVKSNINDKGKCFGTCKARGAYVADAEGGMGSMNYRAEGFLRVRRHAVSADNYYPTGNSRDIIYETLKKTGSLNPFKRLYKTEDSASMN